MFDLVVCGKAYIDGKFEQCEIAIDRGRIAEVKKAVECSNRMDFNHGVIIPGGIDSHVHFRCPGGSHKGDFFSEGAAAACGGITTVVDMPNTDPPTTGPAGLDSKLLAARDCPVDYGFFAGFSKGQDPGDIEAIAPKCAGFKLYMGSTTGSLLMDSDADCEQALLTASHWSKPVWVHAEDQAIISSRPREARDVKGHLRMRPPEAEERAIRRILGFNNGRGLHIAHISTGAGLELVRTAECTSEAAPHHLLLDVKHGGDAFRKVNPPLREEREKALLWDGLKNGQIDIIASDHAPHTKDEKEQEFLRAPSGVPGVETMLPLLMHYANQGRISFERLVDAACTRPAAILGWKDRGVIRPGAVADLAVFDHHESVKIKGDDLHYKCGWTPYEGMEAVFPKVVISKGEVVVKECNFEGEKGAGVHVH